MRQSRDGRSQGKLGAERACQDETARGARCGGGGGGGGCAVDPVIKRVAFDRGAAGGADEAFELGARESFGRGSAGVVINVFLDDGPVQIVCAEAKRDLRD